ncbi:MAG: glycosyltransferase family 2 protein [Fervidobacterium sp.]|jgi:glycosyltransferase involved in cell wall biosynthesis
MIGNSNALKVSVVLPVKDEERTIENVLRALLSSEYENIEILVVDGMSKDKTPNIVEKFCKLYAGKVKLLKNEKGHTPAGLNIGIMNASGKYIMIASGHASYSRNYIRDCVDAIESGLCDVAGGVMEVVPRSDSLKARAIAYVLKHPFGVGGAKYRIGANKKTYVDTVAYGVYKEEIFKSVGLFDENLVRNQDIEFNIRLKRHGYKTMLVPEARAYYFSRDTYKGLWWNNFANGFWVLHSHKFVKYAYRLRHLIPFFFVLYLLSLPMYFFLQLNVLKSLLFSPLILYFFFDIYFSIKCALENRNTKIFFYAFWAFFVLHLSYGFGSLFGLLSLIKRAHSE